MAAVNSGSPANYQENIDSARKYKEIGNERYKTGEYGAAKGQYHRAIIYLRAIDAAEKAPVGVGGFNTTPVILSSDKRVAVDQLYADCQSNLAACLLQSDTPSYTRVMDCCKEALNRVPNNVKANYRLGVALYHLKRFNDAIEVLQKTAKLQEKPDGNVTRYLAQCRKALSDEKQRERDRCKAMFASAADNVPSSVSGNGVTS